MTVRRSPPTHPFPIIMEEGEAVGPRLARRAKRLA